MVRQRLPELLIQMDGDIGGGGGGALLVDVTYDMISCTVRQVLEQQEPGASAKNGVNDSYDRINGNNVAVALGRVVLLVGPTARELGAELNDLLAEWGVVPALIAAHQPKLVSQDFRGDRGTEKSRTVWLFRL